jgi:phospholipase/carboxylesterase
VRLRLVLLGLILGFPGSLVSAESGRLDIPATTNLSAAAPGLTRLDDASGALLYLPKSYRSTEALPLLILLHPFGGNPGHWFSSSHKEVPGSFAPRADAGRFIILAPASPEATWGVGPRAWGNDVATINRAIAAAFSRCAIDRNRIAVGGFSDGASYALSLGLANGDRIRAVVAFSPGFIVKALGRGRPALFISHGREDFILPIDTASRLFVSQLHKNGYNIDYHEFDGGHQIPAAICEQAMAWLATQFHR